MKKNIFKRILSMTTASLAAMMSIPTIPASAEMVDNAAESAPIYGLSTTTTTPEVTLTTETTTATTMTTAPVDAATTIITTADPAIVCKPMALTVEAGSRQIVVMSFSSGRKNQDAPTAYVSDNEAVAIAVQGEYSWCFYVDGLEEGSANITVESPYGWEPVTIPVTVVPADNDASNDTSMHVIIDQIPGSMYKLGTELALENGEYSIYRFNGRGVELVHGGLKMSDAVENVTVDKGGYDSMTAGYYDVSIAYADNQGYADTATFTVGVYDFGDTVTATSSTDVQPGTGTTPPAMDTTSTSTTTTVTTFNTTTFPTLPTSSTMTTAEIGIVCEMSEVEVEAGKRIACGSLKFTNGLNYNGALPVLESSDPAVAIAATADTPSYFYIIGLSEGTAVITIYDTFYDSSTTVNVTVTGTFEGGYTGNGIEIDVVSLPDKLIYRTGEELDLTGGVFNIEGIVENAEMSGSAYVDSSAFDSSVEGTYPILISLNFYDGRWGLYKFNVTVSDTVTGDADSSGNIDLGDASYVLSVYAKNAALLESELSTETADIDGDDEITIIDASYILNYYAKTAAGLPCTWDDIISG